MLLIMEILSNQESHQFKVRLLHEEKKFIFSGAGEFAIQEQSLKLIIAHSCESHILSGIHFNIFISWQLFAGQILYTNMLFSLESQRQQTLLNGFKEIGGKSGLVLCSKRVENQEVQWLVDKCHKTVLFLDLRFNKLKALAVGYIVRANFQQLQQIYLAQNNIGDEGVRLLSQGKWLNLTIAVLYHVNMTDDGARHLAQALWNSLIQINLNSNFIGEKGAESLTQGKWPKLNCLLLDNNPLKVEGVSHLIKGSWENLNTLELNCTFEGDQAMHALKESRWKELQYLSLRKNKIGNKGIKSLTAIPFLQLKGLFLDENEIDDGGVVHLSKGNWPSLERLQLSYNKFGDNSLCHLIKANWTRLVELNIQLNKVTQFSLNYILISVFSCRQIYPWNELTAGSSKEKCAIKMRERFGEAIYITD